MLLSSRAHSRSRRPGPPVPGGIRLGERATGGRHRKPERERVSLGPTGRAALIAAALAVPLTPIALGHVGGSTVDPESSAQASVPVPGPTVPAGRVPSGTVPIATSAPVAPAASKARPVAAPSGLNIPAIGLTASGPEQLGLDAQGRLGAPADYDRIGWYAQGPKPGQAGPAVIVGHVDSFRGPAVFFRLRDLKPGDKVVVPRVDGWRTTFTVDAVRHYPKDAFPSQEVYGPTANAQLRLITCGGPFDHGARSYEDNVVVFASVH